MARETISNYVFTCYFLLLFHFQKSNECFCAWKGSTNGLAVLSQNFGNQGKSADNLWVRRWKYNGSRPLPLLLILAEKLFLDLTITCYGCDDNHMQYYHFPNDWSCFALPDIIYVLMADGQLVRKTELGSRLKFSSIVKWIPNQILWNDALELTSFFVPWHKRRLSLSLPFVENVLSSNI